MNAYFSKSKASAACFTASPIEDGSNCASVDCRSKCVPPELAGVLVEALLLKAALIAAPLFVVGFVVIPLPTGAFIVISLLAGVLEVTLLFITGACIVSPLLAGDCAITALLTALSLGIKTRIIQRKTTDKTEIGFRNCRNMFTIYCIFVSTD